MNLKYIALSDYVLTNRQLGINIFLKIVVHNGKEKVISDIQCKPLALYNQTFINLIKKILVILHFLILFFVFWFWGTGGVEVGKVLTSVNRKETWWIIGNFIFNLPSQDYLSLLWKAILPIGVAYLMEIQFHWGWPSL